MYKKGGDKFLRIKLTALMIFFLLRPINSDAFNFTSILKENFKNLKHLMTIFNNTNNNEENSVEPKNNRSFELVKSLVSTTTNNSSVSNFLFRNLPEGVGKQKVQSAWENLFATTTEQNISEAGRLFDELAADGEPEGHFGLFLLYGAGIGRQSDDARALVHLTLAALGDSPAGKMALGFRYWEGISVLPSCEKAVQLYRSVAESALADFRSQTVSRLSRMPLYDEPRGRSHHLLAANPNDLKDYYEMLAERGDPQAAFNLGHMYYYGTMGIKRDIPKALHYFQLAQRQNRIDATAYIGRIYLEREDLAEAFSHLKRAADEGNPVGEAGLGSMYLEGKHVPRNYNEALHYITKSAQKGWVDGLITLGQMYFNGTGVDKDYASAMIYFILAGLSEHPVALYYLGMMHEEGLGTRRSCMSAVQLYKGVAEKGKWERLFVEAYDLYQMKKYNQAYVIYALLAQLGYVVGQSNAAYMLDHYQSNFPLTRRPNATDSNPKKLYHEEALKYWRRAARQSNDGRAHLEIGDHMYYGLGTQVDYESAAEEYRRAAERTGSAEAMYNLGYMHEHGYGLERDSNLARRCYDTALGMSEEAWLPVGLALVKLSLLEPLRALAALPWSQLVRLQQLDQLLGPYWDLTAVAILSTVCAHWLYTRHN